MYIIPIEEEAEIISELIEKDNPIYDLVKDLWENKKLDSSGRLLPRSYEVQTTPSLNFPSLFQKSIITIYRFLVTFYMCSIVYLVKLW